MEKLIYTNKLGGSVEFSAKSVYVLEEVEGLTGIQNELSSSKSVSQDGVTITSSNLKERNITIQGSILGNKEFDKTKLIQIVNPKLNGTLVHELNGYRRIIKCKIEQAPDITKKPNYKYFISLIAPNPYFQDIVESTEELADWVGGLRFPLQLPMMFAGRSTRQQTIIQNNGDVETPILQASKGGTFDKSKSHKQ